MTIRASLQAAVNRSAMATWGQPATYTPASTGTPVGITAVFDSAFVAVETGGEVPVSTVAPVLLVRLADLPADPEQGDAVTVGGGDYEVADVQPDSSGTVRLRLMQAA